MDGGGGHLCGFIVLRFRFWPVHRERYHSDHSSHPLHIQSTHYYHRHAARSRSLCNILVYGAVGR